MQNSKKIFFMLTLIPLFTCTNHLFAMYDPNPMNEARRLLRQGNPEPISTLLEAVSVTTYNSYGKAPLHQCVTGTGLAYSSRPWEIIFLAHRTGVDFLQRMGKLLFILKHNSLIYLTVRIQD